MLVCCPFFFLLAERSVVSWIQEACSESVSSPSVTESEQELKLLHEAEVCVIVLICVLYVHAYLCKGFMYVTKAIFRSTCKFISFAYVTNFHAYRTMQTLAHKLDSLIFTAWLFPIKPDAIDALKTLQQGSVMYVQLVRQCSVSKITFGCTVFA